jgi:hypothetical protein
MSFNEKFLSVVPAACGLIALGSLDASRLQAQTRLPAANPPPSIIRITDPITLDGLSNEPVWQEIAPLPLTVREPTYGAAPSERTEIRIAHDATYLYVSGRLYDSDPDGIRINSMYRDQQRGDDVFGILVNPYDDNEIGLVFWTTPGSTATGTRTGTWRRARPTTGGSPRSAFRSRAWGFR